MEAIKATVQNIAETRQMPTTSQNQPISTTTQTISPISRENHAALFFVINQSRLVNGWTSRTAQDLDPTIRIWAKVFKHNGIPVDATIYDALYLRALDLRQTFLQNGKEPPMLNAELVCAGWTGLNGLKAELERKRIASGKFLGENAESVCSHCFGTSWKVIEQDGYKGTVKCGHGD